ncbi:exosortase Q [Parachitinimonas caeni]|uniref:Exosortase Q n=1 Tax=Parachitinimonas caeni TaxID=3031301 RepID=A0ABT7DVM8_9NEIS|nr:exosortase Q [Parachitinimonas caeni]MDK2124114.1 exosortase Q [Parachitinimonas caeni]
MQGLNRLPGWSWLLLSVLPLWPIWAWAFARMRDGSDDPLGLVALLVLLALVWRDRLALRRSPRLPALAGALLLTVVTAASGNLLPPLIRAVWAVAAVLLTALAIRPTGLAVLPWLGLGWLALPIISSLQFFAGYPLRVLTAEATAQLLRLVGIAVERQGSALALAGQLVMVDAPCSGVQMGWMAYFTACATAGWFRLADRQFLGRLPWVGVIVLSGNIVRNSVLVVKESGLVAWPAWTHEATGLVVFAGVCGLVLRLMAGAVSQVHRVMPAALPLGWKDRSHPRLQAALAVGFAAVLCLSPWTGRANAMPDHVGPVMVEWPSHFDGRPLRPLALSSVERAFLASFPGAIGRFDNGEQVVTLRQVNVATRKLHPASDCFRGLGYQISAIGLLQRPDSHLRAPKLQRCFIARKGDRRLHVCELIEDRQGRTFTDVSAWYWSAQTGESTGPWQVVTTARPI